MGMLDDMKKKMQDLLGDHGDKAKDGVDKGADLADDKTGGAHSAHIDKGAEAAKGAIDDAAATSEE